jgi:hypothetical protein
LASKAPKVSKVPNTVAVRLTAKPKQQKLIDMEPTKQHYSEREEDTILFGIYSNGGITIREFLEFSNYSFSKELLKRVEERTDQKQTV